MGAIRPSRGLRSKKYCHLLSKTWAVRGHVQNGQVDNRKGISSGDQDMDLSNGMVAARQSHPVGWTRLLQHHHETHLLHPRSTLKPRHNLENPGLLVSGPQNMNLISPALEQLAQEIPSEWEPLALFASSMHDPPTDHLVGTFCLFS